MFRLRSEPQRRHDGGQDGGRGLSAAVLLLASGAAASVFGVAASRSDARAEPAAALAPIPVRTWSPHGFVSDLAPDGESAAILWAHWPGEACVVSIWHPRTGELVRVGPQVSAGHECDNRPDRSPLAYANGRVAWFESQGSITRLTSLVTASITRPSVRDVVASNRRSPFDECVGPDFGGGLVGRGQILAFTTWTYGRCASPPSADRFSVVDHTIWRVADNGVGVCPRWDREGSTSMCLEVTKANGMLVPLDVDGGRIAALTGTNTIELLNQTGETLRTLTPTATPRAAVLTGRSLAILAPHTLEVYDTQSRVLTHSWPLPDVPTGGRCTNLQCPVVRLQLIAAARGRVVYLLDGKVHLFRLRDGHQATVDNANAADLTDQGLFYTNVFRGVRFIPTQSSTSKTGKQWAHLGSDTPAKRRLFRARGSTGGSTPRARTGTFRRETALFTRWTSRERARARRPWPCRRPPLPVYALGGAQLRDPALGRPTIELGLEFVECLPQPHSLASQPAPRLLREIPVQLVVLDGAGEVLAQMPDGGQAVGGATCRARSSSVCSETRRTTCSHDPIA